MGQHRALMQPLSVVFRPLVPLADNRPNRGDGARPSVSVAAALTIIRAYIAALSQYNVRRCYRA